MSFLLDTVAASEFAKERPNKGLTEWLLSVSEDDIYLSVATLAEIRLGIELLPSGRRRTALEHWFRSDLKSRFDGRVCAMSNDIAEEWGRVSAFRKSRGRVDDVMDSLIAATANVLGLTVVTRNSSGFDGITPRILNPWT